MINMKKSKYYFSFSILINGWTPNPNSHAFACYIQLAGFSRFWNVSAVIRILCRGTATVLRKTREQSCLRSVVIGVRAEVPRQGLIRSSWHVRYHGTSKPLFLLLLVNMRWNHHTVGNRPDHQLSFHQFSCILQFFFFFRIRSHVSFLAWILN